MILSQYLPPQKIEVLAFTFSTQDQCKLGSLDIEKEMLSTTYFIYCPGRVLCSVQSANVNSIIMKSDKKFGCSLKSEAALGNGGGRNFYNGINTTTRVFTGTNSWTDFKI